MPFLLKLFVTILLSKHDQNYEFTEISFKFHNIDHICQSWYNFAGLEMVSFWVFESLSSLNWVRLNKRWENQLLVMLFKCLIHKAPPYLSSQFTNTQSIHSHGIRCQSSKCLVLPTWNIIPGKRSFHYRACHSWHELPLNLHNVLFTMNLYSFKKQISDHVI